MDDIRFYKDCIITLERLLENDNPLYKDELATISPNYYNAVRQEFLNKSIAKWNETLGYFESINKEKALPLYNSRYYERLYDNAVSNRKRDNLSERSTLSAEKSAEAAQSSADSATKSLVQANKSKIWAIISAIGTIAAALIAAYSTFFK